jgi:hypothetical protein
MCEAAILSHLFFSGVLGGACPPVAGYASSLRPSFEDEAQLTDDGGQVGFGGRALQKAEFSTAWLESFHPVSSVISMTMFGRCELAAGANATAPPTANATQEAITLVAITLVLRSFISCRPSELHC